MPAGRSSASYAERMELTAIGPDVYALLQPDRGLGWSNSGLIARDGGVVVDTFWDLPRTQQRHGPLRRPSSPPALLVGW